LKIFNSLDTFEQVPGAVVTLGTFDGVHRGHLKLIERLKETARTINGSVVLLTFDPHPRAVLRQGGESVKLLTTLSEKEELLKNAGVDYLVVHPFDKQFSDLSANAFIREVICNKLGTSVLVVGFDHRFGHNREGGFEDLMAASVAGGFRLDRIPAQLIDDITVSSTRIRKALQEGQLEEASALLGRHYSLSGRVVEGNKLGRTLGFPTANLSVNDPDKLIPQSGVYVALVQIGNTKHKGLVSIGYRPTFELHGALSVEAFIIDFNADIYGEVIQLEFIKRLRGDIKFNSAEDLVARMNTDLSDAVNYFEHNNY